MEITEKNITVASAILNILAENACTVAQTNDILAFVGKKIVHTATVQHIDYADECRKLL